MGLLKQVHDFCEKNELCYYMAYGTLIGAVRHGGFIPWDDDIDIWMPRSDYEEFFARFNSGCAEFAKAINCDTDSAYYLPFGKVYDTRTSLIEKVAGAREIGVYIDIFPLDRLSSDEALNASVRKKIQFMRKLMSIKVCPTHNMRKGYRRTVHAILSRLPLGINANRCSRRINALSRSLDDAASNTYAAVSNTDAKGIQRNYDEKWLRERVMLPFESEMFYAPAGYDGILKYIYGDYMKLPPEEKRVSMHDYVSHWK